MKIASQHPSGLPILFLTEMWERFSYYGMRALLVLYLVNALDYPRAQALQLYATYTGLVYLSPLIGGYIADKWLGMRRAVAVGGIVMAGGHFAMAFPALLYLGLGLLIVGNGFFKPNISSTVGALYQHGDARRDGGFTLFYMGINLGAFFSPLVCGTLGEKIGWHWGFGAAGVGMLIGLGVFVMGQDRLGTAGLTPNAIALNQTTLSQQDWRLIISVSVACVLLVFMGVEFWPLFSPYWYTLGWSARILLVSTIVTMVLISPRWLRLMPIQLGLDQKPPIRNIIPKLSKAEFHRISVIFIMSVFVVFFWMGFEQAGGTMNLFADKLTDRNVLGWQLPASYFQSINPLVIIMLAPLFALIWNRIDRSAYALTPITKQALGMIILGLGFIVLASAQQHADLVGQVSPLWLVTVYVLHTLGELCLSPIGLSMVTKLAPNQFAALFMGLWFSAMALANYLAGTLEFILSESGWPLYWFLVFSSIGAGVVLLLVSPLLHRLMHGVR